MARPCNDFTSILLWQCSEAARAIPYGRLDACPAARGRPCSRIRESLLHLEAVTQLVRDYQGFINLETLSTAAPECRCLLPGGAAYLLYLSRSLAATCGAVCVLLWLVALRYGAFQRHSQRLYQNVLADTNQARACYARGIDCRPLTPCAILIVVSIWRWAVVAGSTLPSRPASGSATWSRIRARQDFASKSGQGVSSDITNYDACTT